MPALIPGSDERWIQHGTGERVDEGEREARSNTKLQI